MGIKFVSKSIAAEDLMIDDWFDLFGNRYRVVFVDKNDSYIRVYFYTEEEKAVLSASSIEINVNELLTIYNQR